MARTNGPALSAAASSAANPKFPQFTGVLGCELRVQRRPSTDRFASVLIDSEVRTSVPPTLTNFGIGTLVSARGGDKPAVAGLAPRRHGAAFGDAFSRAVELVAGAGDLGLVAQRPVPKRGDRLQQIAPEGRQGIFNARRNGGKHGAGNEAVALQATQSQGQHPLRDAADRTAQFV